MPDLARGKLVGPGQTSGAFCFDLGNPAPSLHLEGKETAMPLQTYLILLISVLAAAGASVTLLWALGVNVIWLGLAALLVSLMVRQLKW
jgi:hypothetical protein